MRATAASGFVLLLLTGCGDTPVSSPPDASVPDAPTADVTAADTRVDDVTVEACVGRVQGCGRPCPGDFVPVPLTVNVRNVCSPAQLKQFWDVCFSTSADLTTCNQLIATKTACVGCILGPLASSPAVVDLGSNFTRVNVGACISATTGKPACGQAWEDARSCGQLYCDDKCRSDTPAECLKEANSTYCAQYVKAQCSSDAGANNCESKDFEASYYAATNAICATGPKDAGAD